MFIDLQRACDTADLILDFLIIEYDLVCPPMLLVMPYNERDHTAYDPNKH